MFDFHDFIRSTESDLDDFSQRFGIQLRCRLTVVLFPSYQDLSTVFGRSIGATMLVEATAVVLAADYFPRDMLRHEMARLFAARLNMFSPPLLKWGLAAWMQGTQQGVQIEEAAGQCSSSLTPISLRYSTADLSSLRRTAHCCYVLAGGFTGFLIRTFGWDRYRDCYRVSTGGNFRSCFEKQFGMSLEWAWQIWRESLLRKTEGIIGGERFGEIDDPWLDASPHPEIPAISGRIPIPN